MKVASCFCLIWVVINSVLARYQDISYNEMQKRSFDLLGSFATVQTAERLWNITAATQGKTTCSPAIIRITNMATLNTDVQRPQILISGEIHGDERVVGGLFLFSLYVIHHFEILSPGPFSSY